MSRRLNRRSFVQRAALACAGAGQVFSGARASAGRGKEEGRDLALWYDRPAREWTEALPVGNGRLGAMVFGGTGSERLQLNEDTLYGGGPYDPNNPEALAALPEARRLIFAGRYREAHDLIEQRMMARPFKQMPYQPLGDLLLAFRGHAEATDYSRGLDLDTAVASVSYAAGGVRYVREIFSSHARQIVAVWVAAERRGRLSFRATLTTPQKGTVTTERPGTLVLRGRNGAAFGVEGADWRDGFWVAVNYSSSPADIDVPAGADIIRGSRTLRPADVLVWK